MTGYLHKEYAESFSELGNPLELPCSKGWIIKRRIPGFSSYDAMGCYPMILCKDWSQLHKDLDNIQGEFVSLALVTDPFGDYDIAYLKRCFPDVCMLYKQHYVTDLSQAPSSFISDHHKRNVRKALKRESVEICEKPLNFLDDWHRLYGNLIKRHHIKGMTTFSK